MIPESLAQLLGAAASVTLVRGTLVFCTALAVTVLVKRLAGEIRHLVWLGVIAASFSSPWPGSSCPPLTSRSRGPRRRACASRRRPRCPGWNTPG